MADIHAVTDDLIYDLVSVQYHALNGSQLYDKFKDDAQGHDDVTSFFDDCAKADADRAEQCHRLIAQLTSRD